MSADRSGRRWVLERLPLVLYASGCPDTQGYRLTVGGEVWSEGWSLDGTRADARRGVLALRERRYAERLIEVATMRALVRGVGSCVCG